MKKGKIKLLFLWLFCLNAYLMRAQECKIEVSGGTIEGSVVAGNGTVNITNIYYTDPSDSLKNIIEALKKENEQLIVKQKKSQIDQEKIDQEKRYLEKRAKELEVQEQHLEREKFKLDRETQNFVSNKNKYQLLVDQDIEIFKQQLALAEDLLKNEKVPSPQSKIIYDNVKQLQAQGEEVIQSLNCMVNDFQVYELVDQAGKTSYAFSLEELWKDPKYLIIDQPVEGLSRVKKQNVYGFLDATGKVIIDFQYQEAKAFNQGRALVRKFKDWYLIDREGNKVVSIGAATAAEPLSGGRSLMTYSCGYSKNCKMVIDSNGQAVTKQYENITEYLPGKLYIFQGGYSREHGLLNYSGEEILKADYYDFFPFDQYGFATVTRLNQFGKINDKGAWILSPDYRDEVVFTSATDRQIVTFNYPFAKGVCQGDGQMVLPCIYREISPWQKGKSKISSDLSLWGLVDKDYNIILAPVYKEIVPSNHSGYYWLLTEKNGWELVDSLFQKIGKENHFAYVDFDGKGMAMVQEMVGDDPEFPRTTGLWGIIDIDNKYVVKPKFIKIDTFDPITEVAIVQYNIFSTGIIDRKGKSLIKPQYELIELSGIADLYRIKLSNKWGLINLNEKVLVEPQFSKIEDFDDAGYAKVYLINDIGLIDQTGKLIIPPKDYSALNLDHTHGFIFATKGRYASNNPSSQELLDFSGKVVIDCHRLGGSESYQTYTFAKERILDDYLIVLCQGGNCDCEGATLGFHFLDVKNKTTLTQKPILKYEVLANGKVIKMAFSGRLHKGSCVSVSNNKIDSCYYSDFKWSLFDSQGQKIFGEFDSIEALDDQYLSVASNGNYAIWNRLGEQLTEFKYDAILEIQQGVAIVKKGSFYGAVNKKSAEIIPITFQKVEFSELNTIIVTDGDGQTFTLKITGECVSNCEAFKELESKYYPNK